MSLFTSLVSQMPKAAVLAPTPRSPKEENIPPKMYVGYRFSLYTMELPFVFISFLPATYPAPPRSIN